MLSYDENGEDEQFEDIIHIISEDTYEFSDNQDSLIYDDNVDNNNTNCRFKMACIAHKFKSYITRPSNCALWLCIAAILIVFITSMILLLVFKF